MRLWRRAAADPADVQEDGDVNEVDAAVVDAVRAELDLEMASAEGRAASLDTKSGLTLGFSGVLLGLTVGQTGWVTLIAQLAAAISAACACAALVPKIGRTVDPAKLLQKYWNQPVDDVRLQVLRNRLSHHTADEKRLERKRRWFLASALCLGAATAGLLAQGLSQALG